MPAVQLGVTLCSLALGWIGEPLAAAVFLDWLNLLPTIPPHALVYAHLAAVAVSFAFITYMQVLVGELVPKSLALRRAEAMAVAVAPPMLVFMALARPAVRFLRNSAALVLRGFDVPLMDRSAVHSPEELKLIATAARRMGVLPKFQETLVHRALELDDVPVREIMTPRQKIFSLPSDMPVEEASARVIDHMHSRVPVYDETRGPEHIVGVVYSKDLARLIYFRPKGQRAPMRTAPSERPGPPFVELRVSQVMRDVLVVPETKTVLDLIRDFQQRRRQMAIVVDEYGSTVGLVTAEDAIEQLTGELEDEFDDPARPVLTTASGALAAGWGREPARPRDTDAVEPAAGWRSGDPGGFHPDAAGETSPRRGERRFWRPATDGGGNGWKADQQGPRGTSGRQAAGGGVDALEWAFREKSVEWSGLGKLN